MRELRRKRLMLRLLYSRFTIGVLAVMVLVGLNAVWNVYGKYKEAAKERAVVEEKLTKLEGRTEKLKEEISRLETEEGREKEFRTKFGLAREGEGVIIIVAGEEKSNAAAGGKSGFWERVKNMLGI